MKILKEGTISILPDGTSQMLSWKVQLEVEEIFSDVLSDILIERLTEALAIAKSRRATAVDVYYGFPKSSSES